MIWFTWYIWIWCNIITRTIPILFNCPIDTSFFNSFYNAHMIGFFAPRWFQNCLRHFQRAVAIVETLVFRTAITIWSTRRTFSALTSTIIPTIIITIDYLPTWFIVLLCLETKIPDFCLLFSFYHLLGQDISSEPLCSTLWTQSPKFSDKNNPVQLSCPKA